MPFWLQHPFAAGVTLAGFTAVSVNDKWEPAFIDSSAGAIHKVGLLAFICCRHAQIMFLVGKSAIFGCLFQHRLTKHGGSTCSGSDNEILGTGRYKLVHRIDHLLISYLCRLPKKHMSLTTSSSSSPCPERGEYV
jgi:hypothetical protein